MNFFGVGPLEVALIIVVAVIVLGPERIPEVASQLARTVKFLRGYANDATSQLRGELSELTREYEDVRKELEEFRHSMRQDLTSLTDDVSRLMDEAQPIVEPGGEPPPGDPKTSAKP
jgi:sec-independent protein translocase protein TatB